MIELDPVYEREVSILKPLIFKYFKVVYKIIGYRDDIDVGLGVGVDEPEYEEVKREEVTEEEYQENRGIDAD